MDSTTVDKLVTDRIREMFPPVLLEGIAAWTAGGQQGPIYVPSFSGSNSTMNQQNLSPDLVTPPPNAAAQPPLHLVAPTPPTAVVVHTTPEPPENNSPAAGTRALVSTLAELDAITKVTN